MIATDDPRLTALAPGSHVCWIVDDETDYVAVATSLLREGQARNEKILAFGPRGSADLEQLAEVSALTVDPYESFLGGGSLVAEDLLSGLREQVQLARDEGYAGLRLVADMDWLLQARPTTEELITFEALGDFAVRELGVTAICAYRTSSFGTAAMDGALCTHPLELGAEEPPLFRMVAGPRGSWRLSGELDLAVNEQFAAAIGTAATAANCTVDVSGLVFIDLAGMRAIAEASRATGAAMRLEGAAKVLLRGWQLARFHECAPLVEFA